MTPLPKGDALCIDLSRDAGCKHKQCPPPFPTLTHTDARARTSTIHQSPVSSEGTLPATQSSVFLFSVGPQRPLKPQTYIPVESVLTAVLGRCWSAHWVSH